MCQVGRPRFLRDLPAKSQLGRLERDMKVCAPTSEGNGLSDEESAVLYSALRIDNASTV